MERLALIVSVGILCFGQLYARADDLFLENYLQGTNVSCIYQDSLGYLWIGTFDNGLFRYDGYTFVSYTNIPNDTTSLSNNLISCINEDRKGCLWIGTKGGLNYYDNLSNTFLHFSATSKLSSDWIRSVAIDPVSHNVWVGTVEDGLFRLEKKSKKAPAPLHFNIYNFSAGACDTCIADRTVFAICFDHSGRGWIGTANSGIFVFQVSSLPVHFHAIQHSNSENSIAINEIYNLYCDAYNCIWASGRQKNPSAAALDRIILPAGNSISISKIEVNHFLPDIQKATSKDNMSITGFIVDRLNNCWACSFESGIVRFKYPSLKDTSIQDISHFSYGLNSGSLPTNNVYTIYQKHGDLIWLGTSEGLSKYICAQQFFTKLNCGPELSGKLATISSAFEDEKGNLWLGGDKWFGFKNNNEEKAFTLPGNGFNPVNDFASMSDGTILIGSNQELYRLTKNEIKSLNNNNSNYRSPNFFCFAEDSEKITWIGTSNGLEYFSDSDSQIQNTILINSDSYAHSPKYYMRCIAIGDHSTLWIGSQKGLWRYNVHSESKSSLSDDDIRSLYFDSDTKKLWMATAQGLKCYNTSENNFEKLNTRQDFLTESINGIIGSGDGNLWFTTNSGLIQWNPRTNQTNYFGAGIPLFANEEKRCILIKKRDGTLLAINSNGIYALNPSDISFSNDQSPIVITDFAVRGASIFSSKNMAGEIFRKTDTIVLDPDQNNFAISFASLNYGNSGNSEYTYSLVRAGDSIHWSAPQLSTFVNYPEAGHGSYTFYVKDINGNAQNLGTIIIKPHFYETVFFYISVILFFMLLGGLIFYIFYRVRLQRILLAQRIRNKIASDLHDDIGSSLNSISVYSEIVKRRLDGADPKTMTVVENMGNTSRQMIDNMSDIVWAINQKNDDFEQILQRMKHFAGELLAEKHIGLHFNFDEQVKKIKLPMEKRKSFYLIYKEAINNAFKYSDAKNVDVQLHLERNELSMIISDDGKGFKEVKTGLGGNGLKNMKARADEVKAKLEIKSDSGNGTQVYLNLHVK